MCLLSLLQIKCSRSIVLNFQCEFTSSQKPSADMAHKNIKAIAPCHHTVVQRPQLALCLSESKSESSASSADSVMGG